MPKAQQIPGTIVPYEFAEPIGLVAIMFSALEKEMEFLIWQLMRLSQDEGNAVTAPMLSFQNRVQLLEALGTIHVKEQSERDKFKTIIKNLGAANAERNNLLHGTWYYWSPSKQTIGKLRTTARGEVKHKLTGFTRERIVGIARNMFDATGQIQRFRMVHAKTPPD